MCDNNSIKLRTGERGCETLGGSYTIYELVYYHSEVKHVKLKVYAINSKAITEITKQRVKLIRDG